MADAVDADAFLLTALAQSDCLDDPSALDLPGMSWDALVRIVTRCLMRLQAADPDLELSVPALSESGKAPVGVAARHRVTSQLANTLKELGYAGDCGYNHFLYPSEKETRKILTWLVGRLPRAHDEAVDEDTSTGSTATAHEWTSPEQLSSILASWMHKKTLHSMPQRGFPGLKGFQKLQLKTSPMSLPWLDQSADNRFLFEVCPKGTLKAASLLESLASYQCARTTPEDVLDGDLYDEEDLIAFDSTKLSDIKAHPAQARTNANPEFLSKTSLEEEEDREFAPIPIDDLTIARMTSSLKGAATLNPGLVPQGSLSSLDDNRADSAELALLEATQANELSNAANELEVLEEVQAKLSETHERLGKMRIVLEQDHQELEKIQQRVVDGQLKNAELRQQLATRTKILAMLPQANENIEKLKLICASNTEKLQKLASEWESHRLPLVQEETQLLAMKSNRKLRCRQLVLEMKKLRHDMKAMASEVQDKMETLRVLEKTYARLPQNLDRNMYTARIMDIIKQVHKQKQDITKIIDDIKDIQKQLNLDSEKLKRSEAVAEDKIYTAASQHAESGSRESPNAYVECYRKFARVREVFEELLLIIGDVGKKENTARDLENWITQLQSRDSSRHLEKVLTDLQSVRQENDALTEQLRSLTVTS